MKANRLIDEKYWSLFIKTDSETGATIRDGHKFEELIECLLNLMYSNLTWEPTKMTHDGNKDFKAKNENEIYWAECKNYKTKIDLKILASTLVMAEIENVNSVLFFCYSEINNNTKAKLNSYSKSNQKSIYFFDGIILDQLILKYKEDILPLFFPDLHEISMDNLATIIEPTALCYLERNPFLNGTPEFDIQNLTELQDLKLGEIIGIHIIIINSNLSNSIKYSIELILPNSEKFFEILEKDNKNKKENRILYQDIEVSAGETGRKSIYLKFHSWAPKVALPKIICKIGKKKIGTFCFSLISTLRTKKTAFLGSNYIEKKDYMCKACINQKQLSAIYIYGSSGTGKSRMISECITKFIANGYHIIKLKSSIYTEHSTYMMLRELVFAVYGFTEEIIDHILQNSYEKLENYKHNSYQEIFKIIKNIYNNRYSLSQINNIEYVVIFEKMAKGRYVLVVDDIQYWDELAISFLRTFYYYASNMQRKCNSVIIISANTDVLYNQKTMEFLSEIASNSNKHEANIYIHHISGFESVNQSYLFLKEILGIEDDFDEIENLTNFSFKPKYITEVACYLQEIKAIEIVKNKVIISDKAYFKESLQKLPPTLQTVLEKRWALYLENATKEEEYYKKVISGFLFFESVKIQNNQFGFLHKEDLRNLYQYGFLEKTESNDEEYIFEHDSIKSYFQNYYQDWFETAIFYLKNSERNLLKGNHLEYICDLYKKRKITSNDYYNYMSSEYSDNIKNNLNEQILRSILENKNDDTYIIIHNILSNAREEFGEKKSEVLYEIFADKYDFASKRLDIKEYCSIMTNYAENQLKLKSIEKATRLYDVILQRISENPFLESDYIISKIYNRYFVCGRVGGSINQYFEKWNYSMDLAIEKQYYDIEIENYFDKAHSLFLDINAIDKAIGYLEKGCKIYEIHQPQNLTGQYLYRNIQLSFLKKEYDVLKERIWKYNENISNDKKIEFKLFFRIHFLIFKIILCLMEKKECSDFEMENMLEQLNIFQTMQNKLQLYRYYYLYAKFHTKKGNWEKAYKLYQKTFDNLAQNKRTEEICLQREIIAQDMIINFRKRHFPFQNYDMSIVNSIIKDSEFNKVMYCSNEYFTNFFGKYIPLTPIFNKETKEGYLLF